MRLVFLGVAILLCFVLISPASAWLTGYAYRQAHYINGTNDGAQTDYQVSLTVNLTAGTSSGSTVYLKNHNQTQFNDFRITDTSDTLYSYWTETNTNTSTQATAWVNLSSIPSGSTNQTQVYIYYGKSGDSGDSSITTTFPLGDDFPGTSIDGTKWILSDGTTVSVSGGVYTLTDASSHYRGISSATLFGINYAVRARMAMSYATNKYSYVGFNNAHYAGSGNSVLIYDHAGQTPYGWYLANYDGAETKTSMRSPGDTNYHIFDVIRNTSTSSIGKIDGASSTAVTTHLPTDNERVFVGVWNSASATIYTDWVLVRKYTANEPTHSTWGAEETAPPAPPVAEFSANATTGYAPLCVQFTDESTNSPTSWNWSWDDGTANTTTQNPIHCFTNPGLYTITLTAYNDGGNDTEQKVDYIEVIEPTPTPTPAPTIPGAPGTSPVGKLSPLVFSVLMLLSIGAMVYGLVDGQNSNFGGILGVGIAFILFMLLGILIAGGGVADVEYPVSSTNETNNTTTYTYAAAVMPYNDTGLGYFLAFMGVICMIYTALLTIEYIRLRQIEGKETTEKRF